jgi:hypothetical protein
VLRDSPNITT